MENALILLSGGYDSPVAASLLKKNFNLIALHFSSEPISEESKKKTIALAKKIGIKKIIILNLIEYFKQIAEKCTHKFYFILQRRLMWRCADKLCSELGCKYLITGENLGQVSSQTLHNMALTDKATGRIILRPLLCKDKIEIINLSKKLGFYELSTMPEICGILGPKHPATKANEDMIIREEKKIDWKNWVKQALNNKEIIILKK